MKRLPDEALARQLDEFLSQDSKALAAQSARLYDQVAAPADRGMVLFGDFEPIFCRRAWARRRRVAWC
jgi:hypothetical protein